jgi:hypothetical protein
VGLVNHTVCVIVCVMYPLMSYGFRVRSGFMESDGDGANTLHAPIVEGAGLISFSYQLSERNHPWSSAGRITAFKPGTYCYTISYVADNQFNELSPLIFSQTTEIHRRDEQCCRKAGQNICGCNRRQLVEYSDYGSATMKSGEKNSSALECVPRISSTDEVYNVLGHYRLFQ